MALNTFRDYVVNVYGQEMMILMDHLTKKSGILKTAQATGASHGLLHKYQRLESLPSFTLRSIGGSLTPIDTNHNIYQQDLKMFDALHEVDEGLIDGYKGGPRKYFADKFPSFLEGYGQGVSKSIIYGTDSTHGDATGFDGFHQYAKAYGNVIPAGGDSGSRTSIFAVKWNPETCAVLFDKNTQANQFVQVKVLNGGEVTMKVTSTTSGAQQPVYQAKYKSNLGFFSGSKYDIAAYTQIQDADNDRPTADNMDKLLDYVRYDENTVLYMSRLGRRLLNKLKDGKLQTNVMSNDYNRVVDMWNGVPIIIDDNILDTETDVLD